MPVGPAFVATSVHAHRPARAFVQRRAASARVHTCTATTAHNLTAAHRAAQDAATARCLQPSHCSPLALRRASRPSACVRRDGLALNARMPRASLLLDAAHTAPAPHPTSARVRPVGAARAVTSPNARAAAHRMGRALERAAAADAAVTLVGAVPTAPRPSVQRWWC